MNKAWFARKAFDIDELKNMTGLESDKKCFVVEKVVELNKKEFDEFADDLTEDRDFIQENIDLMYVDPNRVWHCMLVKAKESIEGILVQAEGYSYGRYCSYIPDCREVSY